MGSRASVYLDHLGITFMGPSGDGYVNPTREIRDAWLALCERAEDAGVKIDLPAAPSPSPVDAAQRIEPKHVGQTWGAVLNDLLAALEGMVLFFDSVRPGGRVLASDPDIDAARAAIAKAKDMTADATKPDSCPACTENDRRQLDRAWCFDPWHGPPIDDSEGQVPEVGC